MTENPFFGQAEVTKNMRSKKLPIFIGILLCTGLVMAQSPDQNQPQNTNAPTAQSAPPAQHRTPDPARQAKHLGKQLGLTSDQVNQLTPILADRQQQLEGVRSDTTLTPQDRREKVRGIMDDSKTKIEAVLTDPQKQQYEQMLATQRERRRQRMQSQQQPQPQS